MPEKDLSIQEKDLSISLEDLLITLQTYTKKIDKQLIDSSNLNHAHFKQAQDIANWAKELTSLLKTYQNKETLLIFRRPGLIYSGRLKAFIIFGYTDLMVDGAPSPHQSDTTLRWLIDRLRS